MKLFDLPVIRLNLFDGAAGAGAPAAGDTGAGGDGAQAGTKAGPGSSRRGERSGGAERVVYGKQGTGELIATAPAGPRNNVDAQGSSPDAGGNQDVGEPGNTPSKEERMAKFHALVGGEFKDLYTEETQRIVNQRFKETKGLEETVAAHRPILDMLAQRYKIADGDPAKLAQAIERDDAYWTGAAEEAGMNVEQYREFQKLQRENRAFRAELTQQQGQQDAQRKYAAWMQEAESVRAEYPDFDMGAECENPQFLSMLKSGVPVRHAYEVCHLDAIKGGLVQQTAAQTEKKVVDGIRAKGARPSENGVSSQSGITFKSDVSRLTAQDRAEIARRVARGEKVEF